LEVFFEPKLFGLEELKIREVMQHPDEFEEGLADYHYEMETQRQSRPDDDVPQVGAAFLNRHWQRLKARFRPK